MIRCNTIIDTYLKKHSQDFFLFSTVLPTILNNYWQYVTQVKIQNKTVLYIGISFPQCIAHITAYKDFFLAELAKKNYPMTNIIFYFRSKKNSFQINANNNQKVSATLKKFWVCPEEESEIKNKIKKTCDNDSYHELLYQLYCVMKKNESSK